MLSYRGLDGDTRTTTLTFDPPPDELTTDKAIYRLELAPGKMRPIFLIVGCNQPADQQSVGFLKGLITARRELRDATRDATTIETSNELLNEILCRSAADLQMLMTDTPQGRYPYAGIPWYSTTFGRDGLITALQMLWFDPSVARGVLRRLAAYQAKKTDPLSDAEPGKILHEMRDGEMAHLREVPFGQYYGSVDATPLFVLLAGLYSRAHRRRRNPGRSCGPTSRRRSAGSTGWPIADGDGFVEYRRASELGLANQGWKDSHDAIFHADGRLAEGHIALAEVQGYVFAAKTVIARAARRLGRVADARRLEARCRAPRRALRSGLLVSRPAAPTRWRSTATSSRAACAPRMPASCCSRGIVRPERAAAVADGLAAAAILFRLGHPHRRQGRGALQSDVLSRRLGVAARQRADRARSGALRPDKESVGQLFKGLFDAATYMDLRRLPELFCGFQRQRNRGPTLYPVACSPQAWASATPFSLIEASLGLEFDPRHQARCACANPGLPAFLDEVTLRNLQLGGSRGHQGPPPSRRRFARDPADRGAVQVSTHRGRPAVASGLTRAEGA